jgi:hypothetical protein
MVFPLNIETQSLQLLTFVLNRQVQPGVASRGLVVDKHIVHLVCGIKSAKHLESLRSGSTSSSPRIVTGPR